jgi:hypothetical protein
MIRNLADISDAIKMLVLEPYCVLFLYDYTFKMRLHVSRHAEVLTIIIQICVRALNAYCDIC